MEQQPIPTEDGRVRFDNPSRNERGIRTTVIVLLVLTGAILVFGLGSGIIARERRNEQVLPRLLTVYAVYPDLSLRYMQYASPADPQMTDDDIPPAPEERLLEGPILSEDSEILEQELLGFRPDLIELTDTIDREAEIPGTVRPQYTISRNTGEGSFGIDVFMTGSPLVSETAFVVNTQQNTDYAQTMVAVAVPVTAQNIDSRGYQAYRSVRVGSWQVFFYDVSLVDSPEPITVTYTMADATVPRNIDILLIDQNR